MIKTPIHRNPISTPHETPHFNSPPVEHSAPVSPHVDMAPPQVHVEQVVAPQVHVARPVQTETQAFELPQSYTRDQLHAVQKKTAPERQVPVDPVKISPPSVPGSRPQVRLAPELVPVRGQTSAGENESSTNSLVQNKNKSATTNENPAPQSQPTPLGSADASVSAVPQASAANLKTDSVSSAAPVVDNPPVTAAAPQMQKEGTPQKPVANQATDSVSPAANGITDSVGSVANGAINSMGSSTGSGVSDTTSLVEFSPPRVPSGTRFVVPAARSAQVNDSPASASVGVPTSAAGTENNISPSASAVSRATPESADQPSANVVNDAAHSVAQDGKSALQTYKVTFRQSSTSGGKSGVESGATTESAVLTHRVGSPFGASSEESRATFQPAEIAEVSEKKTGSRTTAGKESGSDPQGENPAPSLSGVVVPPAKAGQSPAGSSSGEGQSVQSTSAPSTSDSSSRISKSSIARRSKRSTDSQNPIDIDPAYDKQIEELDEIAYRVRFSMPSVEGIAWGVAARDLYDATGENLDPDHVWVHRIAWGEKSTETFSGWQFKNTGLINGKKSNGVLYSQTVTEAYINNFDSDPALHSGDAEYVNSRVGIYKESPWPYGHQNEVRYKASTLRANVWAANLKGRVDQATHRFWSDYGRDFQMIMKGEFIGQARKTLRETPVGNQVENLKEGQLTRAGYEIVMKGAAPDVSLDAPVTWDELRHIAIPDKSVSVSRFHINGFVSSDIRQFYGTDKYGRRHLVLYMPGEEKPFREFSNPAELHGWIVEQAINPQKRQALADHFSLRSRRDGGLDSLLSSIESGNRQPVSTADNSVDVNVDVFSDLTAMTAARIADDHKIQITSNSKVGFEVAKRLLSGAVTLTASRWGRGPLANRTAEIAFGGQLAADGYQAFLGDTEQERKAALADAGENLALFLLFKGLDYGINKAAQHIGKTRGTIGDRSTVGEEETVPERIYGRVNGEGDGEIYGTVYGEGSGVDSQGGRPSKGMRGGEALSGYRPTSSTFREPLRPLPSGKVGNFEPGTTPYFRQLKKINTIEKAIGNPAGQCEALLGPVAQRIQQADIGMTNIKYRALQIWSNATEQIPTNHFVVIGEKGGQQYVFDLSAGQFQNHMPDLNGPLILKEADWAQKYANASRTKLIKYKDFVDPRSAAGEFQALPGQSPKDVIDGGILLTAPNWYKTLTGVDPVILGTASHQARHANNSADSVERFETINAGQGASSDFQPSNFGDANPKPVEWNAANKAGIGQDLSAKIDEQVNYGAQIYRAKSPDGGVAYLLHDSYDNIFINIENNNTWRGPTQADPSFYIHTNTHRWEVDLTSVGKNEGISNSMKPYRYVPIKDIIQGRHIPSDDVRILDVENRIKYGQKLDPIDVTANFDGKFHVINGNHRLIAARRLGLVSIPVSIDAV